MASSRPIASSRSLEYCSYWSAGLAPLSWAAFRYSRRGWVLWGLIAFILAGLAFGPLSRAQRKLSEAAHAGNLEDYERLSKGWDFWGFIALALPIVAFVLMILKPALPAFHR
ncbi:MAG: DUF2269 family protein [Candidatus Cybelea sp.]